MNPADFLVDTSALSRLLLNRGDKHGWDEAAQSGLIAVCDTVELEYLYGARSWADRKSVKEILVGFFGWVPTDERMFRRAEEVQEELTRRGEHRSAGATDLLIAATAELHNLTLLHRDNDFNCIAAVTGQPMKRFGPDRGSGRTAD